MKILVVAPEYGDSPYAASLRYEGLCRELCLKSSITVEVVSGCGKPSSDMKLGWHRILNVNARKGSTLMRIIKEVIFGFRVLTLILFRRPNFVLLSVPNFISSLLTGLFCKIFCVRYFIDTRDLYPSSYALGGLLSENGILFALLSRITSNFYGGAIHHFAATRGLADEIYRLFDLNSAPTVIMNGYPEALCSEILANSTEPTRDVVMHGTFGRMQNVDLLLEVVKKMPDTTFTFIGEGVMFNKIREANLKNLIVHPRLAHRDVLHIVVNHSVGLSVRSGSWYDTMSLPVKIFEFLGLGLGVVSYPKTEFCKYDSAKSRITNIAAPSAGEVALALEKALCNSKKNRKTEVDSTLTREYQSEIFCTVLVSYMSSANV